MTGLEHLNPSKKGYPHTIRRQHCIKCSTILAIDMDGRCEAYNELGLWVLGRWFGNKTKCPKCGLAGNLPMDKPLSWEEMQESKEKKDGKS